MVKRMLRTNLARRLDAVPLIDDDDDVDDENDNDKDNNNGKDLYIIGAVSNEKADYPLICSATVAGEIFI